MRIRLALIAMPLVLGGCDRLFSFSASGPRDGSLADVSEQRDVGGEGPDGLFDAPTVGNDSRVDGPGPSPDGPGGADGPRSADGPGSGADGPVTDGPGPGTDGPGADGSTVTVWNCTLEPGGGPFSHVHADGCRWNWTCPQQGDRELYCETVSAKEHTCSCKKDGAQEKSFKSIPICGYDATTIAAQANAECGWNLPTP